MRSFALAPMSTGLRVLTWICFLIPAIELAGALATPAPVRTLLFGVFVFIALVYASVWFAWRPLRFEVDGEGLRIVWPIRWRLVPVGALIDARLITSAEFRSEFGWGMRVGAGGLWGGFGWLKTRSVTFSMWVSRTDRFVIVRLADDKPLLLTPDHPEGFVEAIDRVRRSAP